MTSFLHTSFLRFPLTSMIIITTSLVMMLILLIILERTGAPLLFIEQTTLFAIWICITCAGFMGANMRPYAFFTAGRQVGSASIVAIHSLLFMVVLAPALDLQYSLNLASIMSAAFAMFVVGWWIAPQLRAAECCTVLDFMRQRFQHKLPAIFTGLATFISLNLLGLAAISLIMRVLTGSFGLNTYVIFSFIAIPAVLSVCMGGLRSILLLALAAGAAITICFAAVIISVYVNQGSLPLQGFISSDTLALIQQRAQQWLGNADLTNSEYFSFKFSLVNMLTSFAGIIGLLSVFGIFSAPNRSKSVSRTTIMTVGFLGLCAIAMFAASAGAILNLDMVLNGARSDILPSFIRDGYLNGSVSICGADANGADILKACSRQVGNVQGVSVFTLQPSDIKLTNDIVSSRAGLALGLPLAIGLLYQLIPVIAGLVTLCLSLFSISVLLGHDIVYSRFFPKSVISFRLSLIRIIWLLSFLVLADLFYIVPVDSVFLCQLSLAIAAAILAPLLLLSLLPRAGSLTAILAALAGSITLIVIISIAPNQALLAGFGGFLAAGFIGAAGLASCQPADGERFFSEQLAVRVQQEKAIYKS